MSGICGFLRFDGSPVRDSDLDRMVAALGYRGPDRKRTYKDGAVGFGHLLMRVTREDLYDEQPLCKFGIALVADLRLDNREELAAALGIVADELAALADSALLLRAYLRWGEACAEHLVGDFAFATRMQSSATNSSNTAAAGGHAIIDWAASHLCYNLSRASYLQGVVAIGIALGAVAAAYAKEHKDWGLKRKDKRDLSTDQAVFSKVFNYVTQQEFLGRNSTATAPPWTGRENSRRLCGRRRLRPCA